MVKKTKLQRETCADLTAVFLFVFVALLLREADTLPNGETRGTRTARESGECTKACVALELGQLRQRMSVRIWSRAHGAGSDLAPGGPPSPPQTGLVAPPPYPARTPAWGLRGAPPASFRACTISYLEVVISSQASLCCMNLFGCCSPAEAGDRVDGRPRFERPALTPCSCCESSSWSPSRRTAGLSPERRLLCARANRECATKRGARTAAIEPAGVVAPTSGCRALFYCPDCRKPVLFSTLH